MLAILLYVEALEDNETLFVEDARQLCRIMGGDATRKPYLETLETPRSVSAYLRTHKPTYNISFECFLYAKYGEQER